MTDPKTQGGPAQHTHDHSHDPNAHQEGKPAETAAKPVDPKDLPQSINEPGGVIGTKEPPPPPPPPNPPAATKDDDNQGGRNAPPHRGR